MKNTMRWLDRRRRDDDDDDDAAPRVQFTDAHLTDRFARIDEQMDDVRRRIGKLIKARHRARDARNAYEATAHQRALAALNRRNRAFRGWMQ